MINTRQFACYLLLSHDSQRKKYFPTPIMTWPLNQYPVSDLPHVISSFVLTNVKGIVKGFFDGLTNNNEKEASTQFLNQKATNPNLLGPHIPK